MPNSLTNRSGTTYPAMNIALHNLVPLPLSDKLGTGPSDVWATNVVFATGQWVKLRAPSGTGKTTLIHCIWQLRSDYTGAVHFDGQDVRSLSATTLSAYRQQRLSVVFQDLRLFGQLTARENIELKRVMSARPLYEPAAIDDMAARLGVSHVLDQQAATCSYGEQQRIAIIRALMQPFEWLLMDEPFSHLDADNARKAAALIAEECTKRQAGLLLTDLDHDDHFTYTRQLNL